MSPRSPWRTACAATLQTNPDVGVVQADREAIDQELRQARAEYLPSIDLRGAAGPEYTNSPATRNRVDPAAGRRRLDHADALGVADHAVADAVRRLRHPERGRAPARAGQFGRLSGRRRRPSSSRSTRSRPISRCCAIRSWSSWRARTWTSIERILGLVRDLEGQGGGSIADVRQTEARDRRGADLARDRGRQPARRRGAVHQRGRGRAGGARGSPGAVSGGAREPGGGRRQGRRRQPDGADRQRRHRGRQGRAARLARGLLSAPRPRARRRRQRQPRRRPGRRRRRPGAARAALQPVPRRRRHRARARGLPARQRGARGAAPGPARAPRRRPGSPTMRWSRRRPASNRCGPRSRRSARPATSMPSSSISASAACSTCSTPRTSCSSRAPT